MNEIVKFLDRFDNFYLNNKKDCVFSPTSELDTSDIVLYKVNSVTFKKNAPRREALENVLSSLRIEGINFIYLILGNRHGINFYYGIVKDYFSSKELEIDIDEIGEFILEPSIKGNFRGSDIAKIDEVEKREILKNIRQSGYCSMVEGVPGILEKEDEFQGVDRLANVMSVNTEFGFMIVASLLNDIDLENAKRNIFKTYEELSLIAKQSKQTSTSTNTGTNTTITKGTNSNTTKGTNSSESRSEATGTNESVQTGTNETSTHGTNRGTTKGTSSSSGDSYDSKGTNQSSNEGSNQSKTTGSSESKTKGGSKTQTISKSTGTNDSKSSGTNESEAKGTNEGKSESESITLEYINKQVQDWLKYIDETLLTRFDYGSGKGMFISGMFCFANSKPILKKLENTAISLFSGEKGNKVPLRVFLIQDNAKINAIKNFQLPHIKAQSIDSTISALLSQNTKRLGNIISSKELSLIAGLPKSDVVGLELKEEVEFGLNFKHFKNELELGKLVQSGNLTDKSVGIDKDSLDKHIFITGVTGSGKTTTCQNILTGANLPFLVIEPAKTEYRILLKEYSDLLIFTLGKDNVAPFRLNPFEFFEHESITSRVDMIKASIEAAFDMEAAIPQIIESAIYECYKQKGWNIATNKNEKYANPFAEGVDSFPTLMDLMEQTEKVVKEQGFDDRLKNDYLGSIRARLNGLLVGSKGFMLNTKRSIDFRILLDKKVVFELEEIRNGAEKSLVMGFILANLIEAIKANFIKHNQHGLRHIILIEEAHRLLSKYEAGDSLNKKQGVEVFTDMLAEIRKYGECLMIADQIPNKLAPEILKNTNTKIVHRIFAADDKKSISNTMALEEEQGAYLSRLETGRAILFSGGFHKAVSVQINQRSNTTDEIIGDDIIKDNILAFYTETAKSGAITGSNFYDNPTKDDINTLLEFQKETMEIMRNLGKYIEKQKIDETHRKILKKYEFLSIDILTQKFMFECRINENKFNFAKEFIQKVLNDSFTETDIIYFNDKLF